MSTQLASHNNPKDYWVGDQLELNLTFDTLHDHQWRRLVDAIWSIDLVHGPLQARYSPGQPVPEENVLQYPDPTATYTQHSILQLDGLQIGMDVLITRSIFECISFQIPAGMFDGLGEENPQEQLNNHDATVTIGQVYKDIALHLFQVTSFDLANIGWNQDCQLIGELMADPAQRERFLRTANFLIPDAVMRKLRGNPADYEEILPGLRWRGKI